MDYGHSFFVSLENGHFPNLDENHSKMLVSKAIFRQKTQKFLLCNKNKMFHCSRKDAPWTQIPTDREHLCGLKIIKSIHSTRSSNGHQQIHRTKSHVSVFLKRGGNMQLHFSVMFNMHKKWSGSVVYAATETRENVTKAITETQVILRVSRTV